MINQKEGVFLCVMSVLQSNGIKFDGGEKLVLTGDLKKQVNALVAKQMIAGEISLSDEKRAGGEKYITEYVPGLVSNHVRRDLRLNGGVKDKPKNPGIRAGNKNPMIKETRKALKSLKESGADDKIIKKFEVKLEQMVTEYKKANGGVTEIDTSQLDPEMKKLYESTINKAA